MPWYGGIDHLGLLSMGILLCPWYGQFSRMVFYLSDPSYFIHCLIMEADIQGAVWRKLVVYADAGDLDTNTVGP